MIKVGTPKYWKKNSKGKSVSVDYLYKDIIFDKDGWADATKFLPENYDLVYLKTQGKNSILGWSKGTSWDGLKMKSGDKILYWKRKQDEK